VSWEGGNPFPYYLKIKWGQVGNFPKVLGVPMVYFILSKIYEQEGGAGGSSRRMMNVGCGLGQEGFSKLENVFPT
jgi:hypothetical protein